MNGPYTIRNMPMLLREWKPNFNLKNDMLRTIPIWVKLPQLPLYLWGVKSLSKIGSALGNPLLLMSALLTNSKSPMRDYWWRLILPKIYLRRSPLQTHKGEK
jgi:hypothetical protein